MPDNIRETVEYDDQHDVYYVGQKLGDSYLTAPTLMTPKEYQKWVEAKALRQFFRQKDSTNVQTGGKNPFGHALRPGAGREDIRSWRCAYQDPGNG